MKYFVVEGSLVLRVVDLATSHTLLPVWVPSEALLLQVVRCRVFIMVLVFIVWQVGGTLGRAAFYAWKASLSFSRC